MLDHWCIISLLTLQTFNPIEYAFSKVKLELQSELERPYTTDNETLLLKTFTSITPQNCRNWVMKLAYIRTYVQTLANELM